MRIAITGTPGTGKTSLAKALAKCLGCAYVDVNKIINRRKMYRKNKGEREKIVELKKLRYALKKILSENKNVVIESHLLCEFPLPVNVVVVLRCRPDVLEKRLEKRNYSRKKIEENTLAEALDYCTQRAEIHYANVMDVDATKSISARLLAEKIRRRKGDKVKWIKWLLKHAYGALPNPQKAL